jgi:hypothetical protein
LFNLDQPRLRQLLKGALAGIGGEPYANGPNRLILVAAERVAGAIEPELVSDRTCD